MHKLWLANIWSQPRTRKFLKITPTPENPTITVAVLQVWGTIYKNILQPSYNNIFLSIIVKQWLSSCFA